MTELVSIVIPVYNCERYIQKNVESIIGQSYQNLEIIYVDDGSTDASVGILRAYAENDARIIIIQQKNQGVSAARNMGLKVATGAYISFVDADDYVDSRYIETLLHCLNKESADVSCCGLVLHRPDKDIPLHDAEVVYVWNQQEAVEHLLIGDLLEPSVWGKMFCREVLLNVKFHTDIKYSEDYLFNLEVFQNCKKAASCGNAYYHYVLHENSATTNASILKRAEDMIHVAEAAADMQFEANISLLLQKRKYIGYLTAYNSLLYSNGNEVEALKQKIRKRIKANKKDYRRIDLTKRELFFYYGISYYPHLYEWVFRGIKQILPDRRTFKI